VYQSLNHLPQNFVQQDTLTFTSFTPISMETVTLQLIAQLVPLKLIIVRPKTDDIGSFLHDVITEGRIFVVNYYNR